MRGILRGGYSLSGKLAIVGASYLQLPLIEKAKMMGYETHVFAWEMGAVGKNAADYFYPISIVEKEKICEICKEICIDGICSIASDLAYITVNYVADGLGLIGNSPESAKKSTNKFLMREALRQNGDPIPNYLKIRKYTSDLDKKLIYPVIIKPTDRSGSRGICKLNDREGLEKAIERAAKESFCKEILIEEYVEGSEYSVEYVSYRGVHYFLAITSKKTTGEPFFIEVGHIEPVSMRQGMLEKVQKVVEHALDTLEIKNGASHSEVKIDHKGRVKIIEIGARMGGDCIGSDLVPISTGIDYMKAVIDIAVGKEPTLERKRKGIPAEVVYMITNEDVQIWKKLKKLHPEKIIRNVFFLSEEIGNTIDSSNRIGCYIKKL